MVSVVSGYWLSSGSCSHSRPPPPSSLPVAFCLSPILGVILTFSIDRCTSGVPHSAPPDGDHPCWFSALAPPPSFHLKEKEFRRKRSDFWLKWSQNRSASVDSLSPPGHLIPVVQRRDTLGALGGTRSGTFFPLHQTQIPLLCGSKIVGSF